MADMFVDSTKTGGANTGGSKTDAFLTLAQTVAQIDNGNIYVSHLHAETSTTGDALTFNTATKGNPVRIISIDFSDDSITTGGSITATGSNDDITIQGYAWVRGLTINADQVVGLANVAVPTRLHLEDCTFGHGSSSDGNRTIRIGSDDTTDVNGAIIEFKNCTFNPEVNPILCGARTYANLVGCTFNLETLAGITLPRLGSYIRFESCNLAGDATPTDTFVFRTFTSGTESAMGRLHLLNCNLPSGWSTTNAENSQYQELTIENSAIGAITDPALGLVYYENPLGFIDTNLTPARTGGANDDEQTNSYSWRMATNQNAKLGINYLMSPPISIWIDGSTVGNPVTATLRFADNAQLNDTEFWLMWFTPRAGTATAQPDITNGRNSDPLATSPNLHTLNPLGGWTGSGISVAQKHSVTFTPAIPGQCYVRAFLAKPKADMWVDPYIELS